MNRLITLSGPAGRAVLTLGEEINLSVPYEKLYLADRQGRVYPQASAPMDAVGAFVLEGDRIIMQGCLAGHSAALSKARTALMMSLSAKSQPPKPPHQPAGPRQTPKGNPSPSPQNQPPPPAPRSSSAALLEILQKAAELFPPEQPQPAPTPPRDDTVLNPFPQAFPFSRWRRVEYPGTDRCYLEGEARHKGIDYLIHALPGDRRSPPPGYTRFLRARDGSGFWVRVRRK